MALFLPPAVFTPPPVNNLAAQVSHLANYDVQWNRPIFRPPSLPTRAQIWSEIPFTSRITPKHSAQK